MISDYYHQTFKLIFLRLSRFLFWIWSNYIFQIRFEEGFDFFNSFNEFFSVGSLYKLSSLENIRKGWEIWRPKMVLLGELWKRRLRRILSLRHQTNRGWGIHFFSTRNQNTRLPEYFDERHVLQFDRIMEQKWNAESFTFEISD